MIRHSILLLLAAMMLPGNLALGQNQYNGVDIFATGPQPPLDNWSPGTSATLQLLNDGTGGDSVAADGIYSRYFVPESGDGAAFVPWKVASSGWSPVAVPSGTDNSFFRPQAGVPVTFEFHTATLDDGWMPDPGVAGVQAFLTTVPSPIVTSDSLRVVGSFISELGGADWTANDDTGLMNDAGTGADATAGDGIYSFSFTGVAAGSWEFKITVNGDWGQQVSTNGFSTGGGNFSATTFDTSDTIVILLNSATGRVRVTNDNPLVNPGPPFYATSAAWGDALGAGTQLFDDGTHGDVLASDGIHSRVFTSTLSSSTSGTLGLRVRQGLGPSFPNTGDYPFMAEVGEQVLVQFDTNTVGDGFSPGSHYVWVNPAARRVPPYVQAIGDFMVDFGAGGNWDNNNTQFELVDSGASGDSVAGDSVYARTFANPATAGKQFKAIGMQASWDFQLGGPGEGYTMSGNNAALVLDIPAGVTFVVDAVTGRIGINGMPTRPASLDAEAPGVNSARYWTLY